MTAPFAGIHAAANAEAVARAEHAREAAQRADAFLASLSAGLEDLDVPGANDHRAARPAFDDVA